MRALLSVSDKQGLRNFAEGLVELGYELVASDGTAAYLEEMAIEVTRVDQLTEVPELLGGRVKTLHPRVHAGILARRDLPADVASLEEHEIPPFDLVCVNLYPFAAAAAQPDADEDGVLEMIDVGGPALLRAAAKNHAHVAPICDPAQYDAVLAELRRSGELTGQTRRRLAAEVFAITAAYEADIAGWFAADELPDSLSLELTKERDLAYGENPHQRAALYVNTLGVPHLLTGVRQLQGRGLSATNLLDLSVARLLLADVGDEPACAVVKHANPCGVAVGATLDAAYEGALACDPVSAFGMTCVLNRPVGAELGRALASQFVELLLAPGYDDGALAALTVKPGTRLLAGGHALPTELDLRRVSGGLVVQDRDTALGRRAEMTLACGRPGEDEWRDLVFGWRVCKHATSNAIVIAKDGATLGIGAGQVSRVDSVRIALDKARRHGHDVRGASLASDGFFPFPDGPELALEAGVSAFVQPGGSQRDAEVTDVVAAAGASMVLTGVRHFRH